MSTHRQPAPWLRRVLCGAGVAGVALLVGAVHAAGDDAGVTSGDGSAVERTVDGVLPEATDVLGPGTALLNPVLDHVVDEVLAPVVDPIGDDVLDPVLAPVVDEVVVPVVEPVVDEVVAPVVDEVVVPVVEPVVDDVVVPVVEPVVDEVVAPVVDEVVVPVVEPVVDEVVAPVVVPVVDEVVAPVVVPVVDEVVVPVVDDVVVPVVEPITDRVVRPIVDEVVIPVVDLLPITDVSAPELPGSPELPVVPEEPGLPVSPVVPELPLQPTPPAINDDQPSAAESSTDDTVRPDGAAASIEPAQNLGATATEDAGLDLAATSASRPAVASTKVDHDQAAIPGPYTAEALEQMLQAAEAAAQSTADLVTVTDTASPAQPSRGLSLSHGPVADAGSSPTAQGGARGMSAEAAALDGIGSPGWLVTRVSYADEASPLISTYLDIPVSPA